MKGNIEKFFKEKGFGFITDKNGENRFFHISNVNGPENIFPGVEVEFTPEKNKKGLVALAIKIRNQEKPAFIICGETRIKLSNIKNYGIDVETVTNKRQKLMKYTKEQMKTRRLEALPRGIAKAFDHPLVGLGAFVDNMFETHYKKEIVDKKQYNILYITTYQGDNYRFDERYAGFNVLEKLKELDQHLA